ncbi:MAG: ATP-binding protein [Cytophagaceae bacterium]|jgi:hypothetical protein|nr:ATP-binding protein [Cytophagaceae bacterium]
MEVDEKKFQKSLSHQTFGQTFSKRQEVDIDSLNVNMQAMTMGMKWLSSVIHYRTTRSNDQQQSSIESLGNVEMDAQSAFFHLCEELQLSLAEKLMLVLAYTAQLKPALLDPLLLTKPDSKIRYRDFGGYIDQTDGRLSPTLQTAVYLLAGKNDIKAGVYYEIIRSSVLLREQILKLKPIKSETDHPLHQLLEIDLAYYHYLMNGKKPRFQESEDFPAYVLETNKSMEDLILKPNTLDHLRGPMNFVKHYDELYGDEATRKLIKPGYVLMLYGPPGTGKTMTAAVMGKELGIDVYAVNLSRIVSKYIGETEKNLEKVFNRLQDRKCILFFDEADALFGKRTEVSDAKDRYANQEVAYLLQRIEQFPGLVILASNFRQNLDDAFKRRIINSIFIPPPDVELRRIMWRRSLPPAFSVEEPESIDRFAEKHSLTGANIANIIKLACIEALSQGTHVIATSVLEHFIRFELMKEGNVTG